MILLDASFLVAFFDKRTRDDRLLKMSGMLEAASKAHTRVLIPTPALTEFLAKADRATIAYHEALGMSKAVQVAAFGERAALECAEMLGKAKSKADIKDQAATWAKAKFDWQIIAIAKAENATSIYSFDGDIVRLGARFGIEVLNVDKLSIPDSKVQRPLAGLSSPAPDQSP